MNNKLATTQKAFIESFIQECYDRGLNEKQANDLLTVCRETEALQCDTDFRKGFEQEAQKQAFMQGLKSISQAAGAVAKRHPLISSSLGLGAGAGAIAAPGLLPNDASSGAATGAIGGGLLGMLPGLAKGLKWQGGVGRTAGSALLKGLFSKGTIRGAIGGGFAGAAAGTTQAIKNKPQLINPDTGVPLQFQQGAGGSSSGAANPFGLPDDLMRDVNNYGGASHGAGTNAAPMSADLTQKQNELVALEGQIRELESQLPTSHNPNAMAQGSMLIPKLDALKAQRAGTARELNNLKGLRDESLPKINTLAHQRLDSASRGLNYTQQEYENLFNRVHRQTQGGLTGNLMGLYNNMTGAKERMRVLQPRYDAYNTEIQNAQKLQEMSN